MNRIFVACAAVFALAAGSGLVACGDDDDDNNPPAKSGSGGSGGGGGASGGAGASGNGGAGGMTATTGTVTITVSWNGTGTCRTNAAVLVPPMGAGPPELEGIANKEITFPGQGTLKVLDVKPGTYIVGAGCDIGGNNPMEPGPEDPSGESPGPITVEAGKDTPVSITLEVEAAGGAGGGAGAAGSAGAGGDAGAGGR